MCYLTAKDVLPPEVIELIQLYVEGEYLYIPKKKEIDNPRGSRTQTRKEIKLRNSQIYNDYLKGESRLLLAEKYFLSKKSIDRIILKEKINKT